MSSPDEEGEIFPEVMDYYFVDDEGEPISFAKLPFKLGQEEITVEYCPKIFLKGTIDSGLRKVYTQVVAWRSELSFVAPDIEVLSNKDKTWIKVSKPKKCYEEEFKATIVMVWFLHTVKRNPSESRDTIWNIVLKALRKFEDPPSEKDLVDHIAFIQQVSIRDKDIAKSEYLASFLHDTAEASIELQASKKQNFLNDSDEDDWDDEDEEENEIFDSVCVFCDDGGELLCCEGRCMRSFHPTPESGADSLCESLGYSQEQVDAIQCFRCENCQFQMHQCYACGSLGSSNKSEGAEVFPCVSATCGHFYHPKCVSKLLHPNDEENAVMLESEIAAGGSFACPIHTCSLCKQVEDRKGNDLQFAICRRCPNSYHRKCLPSTIRFERDEEKKTPCRAWEDLLPNRILIYCREHQIFAKMATPRRDHLVFPNVTIKKGPLDSQSSELIVGAEKKSKKYGTLGDKYAEGVTRPLTKIYGTSGVRISPKKNLKVKRLPEQLYQSSRGHLSHSSVDSRMPVSIKDKYSKDKRRMSNLNDDQLKSTRVAIPYGLAKSTHAVMPSLADTYSSRASENAIPYGLANSTYAVMPSLADTYSSRASENAIPYGLAKSTHVVMPSLVDTCSSRASENAEIKRSVLKLIKSSDALFDEEEFLRDRERPKTHDIKKITMGKVMTSVEAIQAALKILDAGGSIEDAKKVCPPEIITQLLQWKKKLHVYLNPFLFGARYTPYGRHFTKVEKLQEIVDRLRWYVCEGDTIVDFCCGSNDFSCLMKEALDRMDKKCSFKNYDLIQTKNDFNFEKKDWMDVRVGDLPRGRELIMGLNPPFGVHASLANKFINKALEFNPKLLILIVPEETERLEWKKPVPYELIWEDKLLLAGKAFYLPGSIDENGNQTEQWNNKTPPLYLWSHPEWAAYHRVIALEKGHIKERRSAQLSDESHSRMF